MKSIISNTNHWRNYLIVLLRMLHIISIVVAISIMYSDVSVLLRFRDFNFQNLEALVKVTYFFIGVISAAFVLWKSIIYKKTNLKAQVIAHLIWALIFVVFFVNGFRILPEVHSFGAEDIRREYQMGVLRLIIAILIWIGLFSIGPILKAWDVRHKSSGLGVGPAEIAE